MLQVIPPARTIAIVLVPVAIMTVLRDITAQLGYVVAITVCLFSSPCIYALAVARNFSIIYREELRCSQEVH